MSNLQELGISMAIRDRIWKTFLFVVFAIASNTLLAANISETDVAAAMKHSESSAHDIHNDSLRVWKNYNHGTTPHYSYRSWARNLILWLKREQKSIFDSEKKVAQVFKILLNQGKISADAAVTLTMDCWGYLVHLEGVPDWQEKKKEQTKHEDKDAEKGRSA